jgi:succinate dehydrogenase/fumarate reductase cytochrome b subunit
MLSVASGHILYAQLRTLRWLIKVLTWGLIVCFLFHRPYGVLLYGCHPLGW